MHTPPSTVTIRFAGWAVSSPLEAWLGVQDGLSRDAVERLAKLGSWSWTLGAVVTWSDGLFRIFGFDPEREPPAPADVAARIDADDLFAGLEACERALREGGSFVVEQGLILPDGSRRATIVRGEVVADEAGRVVGLRGTTQDVTADRVVEARLREREQHFEQLALRDDVTGLANRAAFTDELPRALESSRRLASGVALVMIDLDRFKAVNDSLGHVVGDGVLRHCAARVVRAVRAGDFVARIGGDEFAVIMRDVSDPAEPGRVAQRLVEVMRAPLDLDGVELVQTVSAGIAVADADPRSEAALIGEADAALYAAKSRGRDRVEFFDDRLRARVSERIALEDDLRHALERRELSVDYQPEIDLVDGTVVALEALLRWRRGDEVVEASRFISVAEQTGLITELGAWAIREACSHAARWRRPGSDGRLVTVRVNVSPSQLRDPDLPEVVEGALTDSGLDARRLCLELTEIAGLRDSVTVGTNLARLHGLGVRFAVDDFGAGAGSLLALTRFPLDVLKLDRAFVHALPDEHHAEVVAGVVAFAASLGVPVTAEGVERREQAVALRTVGCRGGQGYLWCRAMPPDDVDRLLGDPHPDWVR